MAEKVSETVAEQAADVARDVVTHPWVERLARLGYAVRGIIYAAIGLLAVEVVLGIRAAPEDHEGVIALIGAQPLGPLLLLIVAIGLGGLALWGFGRAVYDPLAQMEGQSRRFARAGALISGLAYAALLLTTVRVLTGIRSAGDPDTVASHILLTPWGPWLIGLAGAVALAASLVELHQALRADFEAKLKPYALSPEQARWACWLGRCGTAARAIVILLVGLFLLQAALQVDPRDVKSLDETLYALMQQPYGPWVLTVVALGLIAFGMYSVIGALWFRLRPADEHRDLGAH